MIDRLSAHLLHPLCWPRWIRRIGLLLLPLGMIVWATLAFFLVLATPLRFAWRGIDTFWNAQQRQRYRTGYGYRYATRSATPSSWFEDGGEQAQAFLQSAK